MRAVYVPGYERWVTLREYTDAIKKAKAHPDTVFVHGLTSWWPTTGAEIMQQFREGMHERITEAIPYFERGEERRT